MESMNEEEIIEKIKFIDRIKDSGDTYTRDDVVAISGLLDLYNKEKEKNKRIEVKTINELIKKIDKLEKMFKEQFNNI